MSDPGDALVARLAPYRVNAGVVAALLISHDGFVVAADADPGIALEAVAAQVAGVIDISSRLAAELGQREAKFISVELDSLNVVLAPFGDELMLALVGRPDTLTCDYRLAGGGG
jgi:predicted regulator of Ras-like GTPase activity (Roadblock/LC7/MglB family)